MSSVSDLGKRWCPLGPAPNSADLLYFLEAVKCYICINMFFITILWKPPTTVKNSTLGWHDQCVGLGVRSLEPGPGPVWSDSSAAF